MRMHLTSYPVQKAQHVRKSLSLRKREVKPQRGTTSRQLGCYHYKLQNNTDVEKLKPLHTTSITQRFHSHGGGQFGDPTETGALDTAFLLLDADSE